MRVSNTRLPTILACGVCLALQRDLVDCVVGEHAEMARDECWDVAVSADLDGFVEVEVAGYAAAGAVLVAAVDGHYGKVDGIGRQAAFEAFVGCAVARVINPYASELEYEAEKLRPAAVIERELFMG